MPKKVVYEASIEHLQILDEDGKLDAKLAKDTITDEQVVYLYEQMSICRQFDEIAFKLQRSGRMGTYPQNKGQEANAVGAGLALQKGKDWLVPCYRENAALFMHGLPMHYILLHWMGDERGNQIPREFYITPIAIPIGTQMLHATGLAWAAKYRGEKQIACTFFGDGATSEGDFHEAMNFAANLDIPVIFFCQNNHWAISVPRKIQMNSAPPSPRRPGLRHADHPDRRQRHLRGRSRPCRDAAKFAREKSRPVFIEAVTYRLGDHTTADDARRYRDQAEVDMWKQRDPILRVRALLKEGKGLWNDKRQKRPSKERAEKEVGSSKRSPGEHRDRDPSGRTSSTTCTRRCPRISASSATRCTPTRWVGISRGSSPA